MSDHDLSKFRRSTPIDQTFAEFIHQALEDLQTISDKLMKMTDLFELVQNYISSLIAFAQKNNAPKEVVDTLSDLNSSIGTVINESLPNSAQQVDAVVANINSIVNTISGLSNLTNLIPKK